MFDGSSHDTDDIALHQASIEPYAHQTSEPHGVGGTHQADLSKEQAREILRSISVVQHPGFFGFLSSSTPVPQQAFDADEINFLTPHLQHLFRLADAGQRMVFSLGAPTGQRDIALTSGGIRIQENHLYVTLANYRQDVGNVHDMVRVKNDPLYSIGVSNFEVVPKDGHTLIPSDGAVELQVDYQRMYAKPQQNNGAQSFDIIPPLASLRQLEKQVKALASDVSKLDKANEVLEGKRTRLLRLNRELTKQLTDARAAVHQREMQIKMAQQSLVSRDREIKRLKTSFVSERKQFRSQIAGLTAEVDMKTDQEAVPLAGKSLEQNSMEYTVKPGDTLWEIARSHGIDMETIRHQNGLSGNHIMVGQRLVVEPEG